MKYILVCLILVSCGQKDKYREDYGVLNDISLSVSSEHMGGYGRTQCLLCHNAELNIHRRGQNGLDAQAMAEAAKNNGLSQYCLSCHSDNGLPQD